MTWRYIVIAITGLGGGILIAAGVFALISATGMVTRLAGKTHTGKHVRVYEDFIMLGGVLFNLWWVFGFQLHLPGVLDKCLEVVMGLVQGIFVGCLAVSLAEALNATAIFARRAKLRIGVGIMITAVAFGKMLASIIQFINGWNK